MSSETAPPSIPPRKRPVTPAGRPGAAYSGSSSSGSLRPASPEPELTRSAPGAAYAPVPTREPLSTSFGIRAEQRDVNPAPSGAEASSSPLLAAVGSVTATLKKAAAVTTAALSSATHSLTEDHTMSSPVTPPPPRTPRAASATSAAAAEAALGARPTTGRIPVTPAVGAPRRVRLAVSRIDPWSVMKLSFLLSVAIGIMIVISTAVLWFALDSLHVFAQIDKMSREVLGAESKVRILDYVAFQRVISASTIVAVVDVFLLTALATIGAFLYNIVAALVGGVHLTLTDD